MSQGGTSHPMLRAGQLVSIENPTKTPRMYHFVIGSGSKNHIGLSLELVPNQRDE